MHQIPQVEPWYDRKERQALSEYLKSGGWLTEFEKTKQLEESISAFTGSKYCVMTVNGTISLVLALLSLDLKLGDEILVPNLTMIATPNSAVLLGLKPVLVDIEADTLCLDLKEAKKKVTAKTKGILYVPFNGRSGRMEEVVNFCRKQKIYLIEDAAQALGSRYQGKHLGTYGAFGSFSFSVPKIITMGQGGCLITDNLPLYRKMKYIKDFGRIKGGTDSHPTLGWNFKFTDLQAVIGLCQMEKLEWRVSRKKEIYDRLKQGLAAVKQVFMFPTNLPDTVPWFMDIYVSDPDKLAVFLSSKNIATRRIYPAVSSQKIYWEKPGKYPVSEKFAKTGLWLPSSARLKNKEIDYIVKQIRNYYS